MSAASQIITLVVVLVVAMVAVLAFAGRSHLDGGAGEGAAHDGSD